MKWTPCGTRSRRRGSRSSRRRSPWCPSPPCGWRARTPPLCCGSSRRSRSRTTFSPSIPTTISPTRSSTPSPRPSGLRVMGVDPGLVATGFAVLEAAPGAVTVLDAGVITTVATQSLEARLNAIHRAVLDIIESRRPAFLVVEDLYTEYKFPRTAILMGHARGVICLAARQLGGAGKAQVQRSVQTLLGLADLPRPSHVADALGLAVTGLSRVTGITPKRAAR